MNPIWKKLAVLLVVSLGCLVITLTVSSQKPNSPPDGYAAIRAEAEREYAAKSYARAHELYLHAKDKQLTETERRWVEFRLADTLWRAQAGTATSDNTKFQKARKDLDELIGVIEKPEDRDLVWAEAHESLGDFFWHGARQIDWSAAWGQYQQALDWWAGQRTSSLARDRYLQIVQKAAHPTQQSHYYYYSYYGNYIPLEILENALKLARNKSEQVYFHYLIAMTMRQTGGDLEQRQRVAEEFELAITGDRKADWYDDALFHYAEWLQNNGPLRQMADGQWQAVPDFRGALAIYRRLTREFAKGESSYYDRAIERIKEITQPSLTVVVANTFLPDSELQFFLHARNLRNAQLSLYKLDLTRDVRFTRELSDEGETEESNWINAIRLDGLQPLKSWSEVVDDKGDHRPISRESRIEGKLPVGAYLLQAHSGNLRSRDLLLITDASIVMKSSSRQALVYFCDAISGAPIPNANIALWENYYEGEKQRSRKLIRTTGADGIAVFDLKRLDNRYRNIFAAAVSSQRQAFSAGTAYDRHRPGQDWRIYAFTDRAAYRPKESVQWKFIARRQTDGTYVTPANEVVEYQINDPRGNKIKDGKTTLNSFGSAWGSLELTEQFPLGEYAIQFFNEGRSTSIGSAKLFRIEEYKLPEFKVSVKTPEEDGKRKTYRLGDKVSVEVRADYYFGGAVANANVEVLVTQNQFYHYWLPHRDYPWYYDDIARFTGGHYGAGQVVKRETVKTDATGKATLTFDTPRENYNQDLQYRIEARVTDSSRREIVGTEHVRVTRQRYYVYAQAKRHIYRPQEKVTVNVTALDANNDPVSTEGTVRITRDYWYEIWLDPTGKEVKGEELKRLRARHESFPPSVKPGQRPWRLKFRGYQHDDIATLKAQTDAKGVAEVSFTPEREGYYRLEWQSSQQFTKRDKFLLPVKAETRVFVATNATTELGYRPASVEIVLDKDTVNAGEVASAMINVAISNRYVLFTVEAEDLLSYQLVHIEGTSKLVEVPIEAKHVPNVYLHASTVSELGLAMDNKQLVVPPAQHFLAVEVKTDREQYQPQEEGVLSVSTKDAFGRPVATELALGLIDDSVSYIQGNYAGDPRQFYFGAKRYQMVQTTSSLYQKQFTRLVLGKDGSLMDYRGIKREYAEEDEAKSKDDSMREGFLGGAAAEFGRGGGRGRGDGDSDRVMKRQIQSLPMNSRSYDNLALISPGVVSEKTSAENEQAVQVRSDFRSTAFWLPDLKTDQNGLATVKVKYPDSLTTWRATATAASAGSQFGMGTTSARTKQPLSVRLQAPRFFVVGDQVTVSAVINNNTEETLKVSPSLKAEGVTVSGQVVAGKTLPEAQTPVEVKANSEARVDWRISVTHASEAKLKVEGRGGSFADAMERTFTIYEHGIEKFLSRSGKLRDDNVTITLDIPKERKADSTDLTIQVAPSLATTMLDALPYLIDYPYGCTEQTMSRFLPAVITAKTLRDQGIKPETVMNKVFGGIELGSTTATHPKGKQNLDKLNEMTRQGLQRLYEFQHSDGGWGWWKEGESDHFMTAYVVWGLTLAREAGLEVKDDVAARAVAYLDKELVEEEFNFDSQAWMLHALAVHHKAQAKKETTAFQNKAFTNLWNNRERLNAYTRALLALAAHNFGHAEQAKTLVQNLENGVKVDTRPDTSVVQRGTGGANASVMATAHWGEDGLYWRWSDGGVEATAFALRALLAIDPKHKLVEPVMNWLVKNRRGSQWSNTRDTAIVVLTLNDYLRTTGESQSQMSYELVVNGNVLATREVNAGDALNAPSRFAVPRELVRDGANEIVIRRQKGDGPIYFSAEARFFSLEEPIKAAGNEIFVRRQYFRLVNHETLLKGHVAERVLLADGDTVKSGDRIEAVITIEGKNNYEYLLFEDLKPAGLEAVQIRSGQTLFAREIKSGSLQGPQAVLMNFGRSDYTGRSRWVYQELRDRKVALFIDKLPQGVWQVRYELRAEAPGTFHALPVLGHAMYVPEIRTNGDEVKLNVVD